MHEKDRGHGRSVVIAAGSLAPPIEAEAWVGDATPLETLRGRVVALHAFQLLCPGCIYHGIPQAVRLHERFAPELVVLGMHSVFEHHDAMGPTVLRAFLSELRVPFPVAIDAHDAGIHTPRTMRSYGLRGTPSLLLIDREGRVRQHWFGRPSDLEVGAALGELLAAPVAPAQAAEAPDGCSTGECAIS